MKVEDSADIYEDSGITPLINEMELGKYFLNKSYGNNEVSLFLVINCLEFGVKNRIRFSKKNNCLYWDVIVDYEEVKKNPIEKKKMILANSIIASFNILDRYEKLNLNKDLIKADLKKYFIELGWL